MVKVLLINGDMVKPRMNDGSASEWCMFDISVVRSSYYLLRIIIHKEWQKYVCNKTIQCYTLWFSGQPFPSLWWVLFPNPLYAGGTNGIRTGGAYFYAKRGAGCSTSWGFKPCNFWHHTPSSFPFVDLAVKLTSNWHGVKAMRKLCPVEDLTILTLTILLNLFSQFIGRQWKQRRADLGLFRIQPRAPPPTGGFWNFFVVA